MLGSTDRRSVGELRGLYRACRGYGGHLSVNPAGRSLAIGMLLRDFFLWTSKATINASQAFFRKRGMQLVFNRHNGRALARIIHEALLRGHRRPI